MKKLIAAVGTALKAVLKHLAGVPRRTLLNATMTAADKRHADMKRFLEREIESEEEK